jgi:hypothetical protein
MVSSMKREVQTLAISLLVAVISLTSAAVAATVPPVKFEKRIMPSPPFAGSPGKVLQDNNGNIFVADYWATGIVKLDRAGNRIGFVATKGRPAGVALLSTGDLVVSMLTPKPYVAVYSQAGAETAVMGTGVGQFYKPLAVTADSQDTVYVIDSGDFGTNKPCVQVFDKNGAPITTGVAVAGYPANSFGSMAPLSGVKPAGKFLEPAGIDYEKANNHIVVSDTFNGRIQFFQARNGASPYAWVKTIGGLGVAPMNFSSPQGVAFEYARDASKQTIIPLSVDRMYILEKSKHKVVVVDPAANAGAGAELATINAGTVTGGELRYPNDLIYDQATSALFVSSAATASPANLAVFCLDAGTACSNPTNQVSIAFDRVSMPRTVTSANITASGFISPLGSAACVAVGGGSCNPVTVTGLTFSGPITLAGTGKHTLAATGTQAGYVSGADTYNVCYVASSGTAPTLTASAAQFVQARQVSLQGTTVTGATLDIVLNGQWVGQVSVTAADGSWNYLLTGLNEGVNSITVKSTLNASDCSTATATASQALTVTADTVAPDLIGQFSFLSNGATTNEGIQNVSGVVTDDNLLSIAVNGVAIAATAKLQLNTTQTYYSFPATLIRGANTVTVTATDKSGNATSMVRNVTFAPELSAFTVTTPADNIYVTGLASIDFTGTVDVNTTTVEVDGFAATVNPVTKTWSVNIPIRGNLVSYEAVATPTGNATPLAIKRAVSNSSSFAEVAITSPHEDQVINAASNPVTISGKVSATGVTSLTAQIDNAAPANITPAGDGTFSFQASLSGEQVHVIKVAVTANGQASTAVRNIIYDTTPPSFSITSDTLPVPTTLQGNVEPSSTITVSAQSGGSPLTIPASVITYDAYNAANNGIVWHANLAGYSYDAGTLQFQVTDLAGNVTNKTYVAGVPSGDTDGDGTVRQTDAIMILRHLAGISALNTAQQARADVGPLLNGKANPNGQIDVFDALLVMRKYLGLQTW